MTWPARAAAPGFTREEAAQLCGRLAALSRAGLPSVRVWAVLAGLSGSSGLSGLSGGAAAIVAAMVEVGGSPAEGLRLAAGRLEGAGVEALGWLAIASEVIERSGAPHAIVLDRLGEGLIAEITQADEREVALAGPRATATLLAWLPVAGLLPAPLLGVNPLAALIETPIGWGCGLAGVAFWATGRWWSGRLVATVMRAGR